MDGLLNNPNNKYRHLTMREREDLRNKGENAWKNYLKNFIKRCNAVVCLIGQDTHNSRGVGYELDVANSLGIKIIPVRIPNTTGGAPKSLQNKKILNWDSEEINIELGK